MRPPLYTDDMTATPDEAELERLIEYAAGAMSASEMAKLEEQFVTDPAFFYRVAPVLKVLHSREPLPIEIEIARDVQALRAAKPAVERTWTPRKLLLLTTAATVPLHVVGWSGAAAAATVLVAAAIQHQLPSRIETAPMYVHYEPTSKERPAVIVAKAVTRKPSQQTTVASLPTVETPVVVTIPLVVDSATERIIAELVGKPIGAQVTRASLPVLRAPNASPRPVQVLVMAADTTEMSRAERAKQRLGAAWRGAVAFITRGHWYR